MWASGIRRDEQVILSVLGGQRDDYGTLIQRYLPVVQAIARAHVGARQDIDEITQEAFIRAYLHLDQLRDLTKFAPWLASIARNVATGLGRQQTRHTAVLETLRSEYVTVSPPPDHANEELRRAIRVEVDALEPTEREALLLAYFAGKKSREVARILEISDDAARKRIERARAALGKRLLAHVEDLSPPARTTKGRTATILAAVLANATAWRADAAIGTTANATLIAAIAGMGATKLLAAIAAIAIAAGTVYLSNGSPASTQKQQANAPKSEAPSAAPASAPPPASKPDAEPGSTSESPVPTGIPFRGQVQHPDGTPVPGATVIGAYWTMDNDAPKPDRLTATADASGNFVLHLAQPWEKFLVWAEAEQHARRNQPEFAVTDAGYEGAIITLYRAASISGRVLDKNAKPLANMPIVARNYAFSDFLWTEQARSDAQGNYTVEKLIPGEYDLSLVEKETDIFGRDPERTDIVLAESEALNGIDIVFDGGSASISGRVTAKRDGSPIKGARLEVHIKGPSPRYAQSDENGNYTIDKVPDENVRIIIHADHYQYQFVSVDPGDSVDFQMEGLGSVAGQVIDAKTRRPLPLCEVASVGGKTANVTEANFSNKVRTDARGYFLIPEVNLDQATIVCRAPGFQPAFELVSLSPDEVKTGLTIALETGLQLRGSVLTPNGAPIEGAYVVLGEFSTARIDKADAAAHLEALHTVKTGADGSFKLEGLTAGPQNITAFHLIHGKSTVTADLPARDPLRIVLDPAATANVQGVVTKGGTPVRDVYMIATKPGGKGSAFAQFNSDSNGKYQLSDIPAGRVTVCALDPFRGQSAHSRLQRDITLEAGTTITVNFDFPTGTGRIEGRVTAPDVEDAKGNLTCIVRLDDTTESYFGSFTDGAFALENIAPGHATVMLNLMTMVSTPPSQDFTFRTRRIETEVRPGETTQVEVSFTGIGAVTGRVTGVASNEFGKVFIFAGQLEIPEFSLEILTSLEPHIRGLSSVGPAGEFLADGLEAGTYTVFALAHNSSGPSDYEQARFTTVPVTLTDAQPEASLELDISK